MTAVRPNVSPEGRYSFNETCTLLGIKSRNTLRSWVAQGLIKQGTRRTNGSYISEEVKQTLNWEHNAKQWVIPDWVVFKTKPNAYAKKYGYKPIVKLTYDHKLPNIVFDNGETTKEFANCVVVIERNLRTDCYNFVYDFVWDY